MEEPQKNDLRDVTFVRSWVTTKWSVWMKT
jgi:hypothetical protein